MKDEVPAECQRTQAQVVCRCCGECWWVRRTRKRPPLRTFMHALRPAWPRLTRVARLFAQPGRQHPRSLLAGVRSLGESRARLSTSWSASSAS